VVKPKQPAWHIRDEYRTIEVAAVAWKSTSRGYRTAQPLLSDHADPEQAIIAITGSVQARQKGDYNRKAEIFRARREISFLIQV